MEDEDSVNFETKKIRVKLDSLHENFKEQLAGIGISNYKKLNF